MAPYGWLMDGRTWTDHKPLAVSKGQRVEIALTNRSAMTHPMHLHGHHFQVTALDGMPLSGAVRDTVLVPAKGSVRVAFDADNPGRWLFHCHNLYHMAVGMITEVRYEGASWDVSSQPCRQMPRRRTLGSLVPNRTGCAVAPAAIGRF